MGRRYREVNAALLRKSRIHLHPLPVPVLDHSAGTPPQMSTDRFVEGSSCGQTMLRAARMSHEARQPRLACAQAERQVMQAVRELLRSRFDFVQARIDPVQEPLHFARTALDRV